MSSIDPVKRFDALPSPRATAVAATLKIFADELDATGKITMAELEVAGAFGRKTILKHIRAGILPAEKAAVNGKAMWLFEPVAVEAYLARAADLLEDAVRRKKNRPKRVIAPDGYMTLTEIAQQCAVSHWTLRQHLDRIAVNSVQGRHAVKMFAISDLPRVQKYFEKIRRASDRTPEPTNQSPRGKITGGLYFSDFPALFAVFRRQPEISVADLVAVTGCTKQAAQRWKSGERVPQDPYRRPLVALFRQMFNCRLAPDLEKLGGSHRRKYMQAYMAARRHGDKSCT